MSIPLPPAIDRYVRQVNLGECVNVDECFADEAMVKDEGETHAGLSAIAKWRATTKRKYDHSIAPIDALDREGKTVLRASVSGNFPGSPVVLEFEFVLKDGKILSLEITPTTKAASNSS